VVRVLEGLGVVQVGRGCERTAPSTAYQFALQRRTGQYHAQEVHPLCDTFKLSRGKTMVASLQ
jgi:hypothetical protein